MRFSTQILDLSNQLAGWQQSDRLCGQLAGMPSVKLLQETPYRINDSVKYSVIQRSSAAEYLYKQHHDMTITNLDAATRFFHHMK